MASVADLNTYGDATIAAIGNADWALAETKLMQASTALSLIPDFQSARSGTKYDREWIGERLRDVRMKLREGRASSRGGIQVTKVRTRRVSS